MTKVALKLYHKSVFLMMEEISKLLARNSLIFGKRRKAYSSNFYNHIAYEFAIEFILELIEWVFLSGGPDLRFSVVHAAGPIYGMPQVRPCE